MDRAGRRPRPLSSNHVHTLDKPFTSTRFMEPAAGAGLLLETAMTPGGLRATVARPALRSPRGAPGAGEDSLRHRPDEPRG